LKEGDKGVLEILNLKFIFGFMIFMKRLLLFLLIILSHHSLFSAEFTVSFLLSGNKSFTEEKIKKSLSYYYIKDNLNKIAYNSTSFATQEKEENPFRRIEIIFFGALTMTSFSAWMFFSLFNVIVYNDTFGRLRRDQFLILYAGSGILSLSVSISDLLINLKKKSKTVEFF